MTRTSPATPVAPAPVRPALQRLLTDDADAIRSLSDDALWRLLTRVQGALLERPGGTPALSVVVVTPREARLLDAVAEAKFPTESRAATPKPGRL